MTTASIHLTDFSDRLSPMLVKELRQGLRARAFIGLFLGLQIFLAVMLLSASAASTSDQVGSTISGILFTFFGLAVLLVQPLRGISALASEVKGNTIDMMVLTRLSAWRIVFGKWVALVSQSALLFCSIIPYLILRYFLGGMNLVGEVMFLMLMFLTSMGLTAVTVGLSGCSAVLIRSLLPVLGLPLLMWSFLMMMMSPFRAGAGIIEAVALSSPESRIGVAIYAAAIIYIGGSMLSLGASLIAPAAENHALVRRLVAIGLLCATLVASWFFQTELWLILLLVSVIAVPALITALSESAQFVPTVFDPFRRFGVAGRVIGPLLLPTWPSGLLASLVISAVALGAIFLHGVGVPGDAVSNWIENEEAIVILSLFGSLLFPAVWQVFFAKGEGQRLARYLPLLIGSLVMCGVLAAIGEANRSTGFLWFFAWHPLSFLAMVPHARGDTTTILISVVLLNIALAAILFVRGLLGTPAMFKEAPTGDEPPPA